MVIAPAATVVVPVANIEPGTEVAAAAAAAAPDQSTAFVAPSTLVDLSGTGQTLLATDSFQAALNALQSDTGGDGDGDVDSSSANLLTDVQAFIGAFNTLQTDLLGLLGSAGGGGVFSDDDALAAAAQFSQALNAQVTAPIGNAGSSPTTLAQIGIEFQPAGGGALSLNLPALQAALAANPAGTLSLLNQAARNFGSLTAGFAAQATAESQPFGETTPVTVATTNIGLPDLAELLFMAAQPGLNTAGAGLPLLFGGRLANGTASTTLDLVDLLALEERGSNGAATLAQELTALNQYNIVAALIG